VSGRHGRPEAPDEAPVPRRPVATELLIGEWPLVAVLCVCVAGLVVVLDNHFRRGTVLFAGGLVLAAGLRLVLPTPEAGSLAVRSRLTDVLTLGALGLGVLLTALVVPSPT
jgi:Protein of unknown function (DUF3017)